MGCWSRVFNSGYTVSQSGACPASCFNITEPNQYSTKPTIYDDLQVTVTGLPGAVDYYVDQLRRRLGCTAITRSPVEQQFVIELRRGTQMAQVTWTLANNQGAYPLLVSYQAGNDTADNVRFEHVLNAIDWLVQQLA